MVFLTYGLDEEGEDKDVGCLHSRLELGDVDETAHSSRKRASLQHARNVGDDLRCHHAAYACDFGAHFRGANLCFYREHALSA